MRSTVIPVVVLTLVCLISSLALALVNNLTKARVAEQKQQAELEAVEEALLRGHVKCDHDPNKDVIEISEWKDKDGKPRRIFLGKKNGKVVGAAFTSSGEGYGGFITIMMGVDLAGKVIGIEILEHQETPGLGANIENPRIGFEDQFDGKSTEGSLEGKLLVVKVAEADENWEIEALTGATISPRGVVQAVNGGLEKFWKYRKQILAGGIPEGGTK
jgi:electron transport complex protein RnfG